MEALSRGEQVGRHAQQLAHLAGIENVFLAKPFIGAGRARDIAVNVALPFLHAMARRESDAGLAELALSTYRNFPGLAENEITREMRKLLGMPPNSKLSARRHQGLMHLYRSGRREPPGSSDIR